MLWRRKKYHLGSASGKEADSIRMYLDNWKKRWTTLLFLRWTYRKLIYSFYNSIKTRLLKQHKASLHSTLMANYIKDIFCINGLQLFCPEECCLWIFWTKDHFCCSEKRNFSCSNFLFLLEKSQGIFCITFNVHSRWL